MGFYGNITNTSNTTFSFDRIYPNRLAMDANANNDGIFIGRYVLVEYQEKAAYPVAYHATLVNGSSTQYYFYSSTNGEEISKIKYLSPPPGEPEHLPSVDDVNAVYQDGFYEDEILQYYIYSSEKKDWIFSEEFYICVGEIGGYAIFEKTTTPNMKSDYIQNFEIDENHYGQESKGFKGYDSTVWVKSSVEQNGKLITKYVNIADLNSVVPTFDIAADAPTMTPITPHFDADSTNVYYKLHAQPQWGFRIAKADVDKSDENTQWIREFYNPNNDTSIKKYASGVTNGIPDWGDDSTATLPAAIYFNEDGFKKQLINTDERQGEIKKHSTTVIENTIKIEPTGKSGIEYNTHNGSNGPSTSVQVDTQELTINLPAIGNMMSDAWDIIHGPNRDDARTDENSSLQGRLDSFEAFYDNQIPVKQVGGTIIGSKINNAENYDKWENKPLDILYDNTTPNFERDDAWIRTEISTTNLKNGDKNSEDDQSGNSGISIHHTFHATDNSTSSVDKNIENGNILTDKNTYKSDKILSNNLSNIGDKKDFIELYTPYVDAKGHVVGKNIETITLPYGYKTFTTEGLAPLDNEGKEIVEDLYTTINNQIDGNNTSSSSASISTSVANNTQDSIAIEPYNKWIQTQLSNDKLVIAHEVHAINTEKDATDLNDLKDGKIQNEINIPDWDYDKAGHIKKKGEHTYTLPFGFKTIQTANSSGSGEAPAAKNTSTTYNTNTTEHVADTTQDTLKFSATNKWITMQADTSDDVIKFGHVLSPEIVTEHHSTNTSVVTFGDSFNILNFDTDEAGHITRVGQTIITTPTGSLEDTISSNTANVLTSIKFTPSTGKIETTHQDVGTLKLGTAYTANKNGALTFDGENTINDALSAIQAHINESEYTESGTQYFIDSITQIDGKITTTRKGTAGTLIVGYDTTNKLIGKDDSVNTAFDTIDKAIAKEVSDRIAADTAEATARANAVTTEKNAREAADNAEKLAREAGDQAERAALNAAIEQEVSDRDDAISAAIAGLVDSAPDNLNTLQKIVKWIDADEDGAIDLATNVAKNAEDISLLNTKLKSAAYETKETFVLKTDYDTKVASLEAVILDLTNRIAALETKMEDNHPTDEGETL